MKDKALFVLSFNNKDWKLEYGMAVTRWLQGRNAHTYYLDIPEYFRPGGGAPIIGTHGRVRVKQILTPKRDHFKKKKRKFYFCFSSRNSAFLRGTLNETLAA